MPTTVHHSTLRTPQSAIILLALFLLCLCPARGLASGGFVISGYNPYSAPAPGNLANTDGVAVDLGTGLFVPSTTDLVVPDVLPLILTRTFHTSDFFGPFGAGASHSYEVFLIGDESNCTYAQLILPDGGRIQYDRTSGSGCPGSTVMTHTATPTAFYKSTLSWNSTRPGWTLTLTDGTLYQFTLKTIGAGSFPPPTNVLDAIQDRTGNRVTLTRDPNAKHRITRITSPNGRYIDFTYGTPAYTPTYGFEYPITQARDHSGRTVNYSYDSSGRLFHVTDPAGGVREYLYDAYSRMTVLKDAKGTTVLTNTYDVNGRMYSQTLADGSAFSFSYLTNDAGKVTTAYVYDPRVALRKVDFNTAGYNRSGYTTADTRAVNQPLQQTTLIERQSGTNFVSAVVDLLNRRTTYAYTSKGRVTSVTRLAGTSEAVTSAFTYEPTFNQVQTATDPLGHTTSLTYDGVGNLIALAGPNQQYTTLAYNSDGQPTAIADWVNIPANLYTLTQFGYNSSGDLLQVVDGMGQSTLGEVDSAGRLTKQTAPLQQKAIYQYDALSRLTKIIDPLTGQTQFTYDANSNLLSVKDAKNHTTSYTYDLRNRPVTRTDALGRTESYQYDGNANLTRVTDRKNQVTTFVYDLLNRRTQTTAADTSTTTYSYDQGNRLTQANDSVAGATLWSYDNLNRVIAEGTNREIIGYNYDAAGRRTNAVTTVGNKTRTYSYDTSNRLTQLSEGSANVGFQYDNTNRRTKLTLPNTVTVDTVYDQASRITGLTYKMGSTVLGNLTYGYDANGRRTNVGGSMARTNLPAPFTSATYDNANEQLTMGTRGMTYDNNGNLTSLTEATGLSTFTWNARNQLAGMTGPGLSGSFVYDPLGRRIKRTLNSAITQFAHDGSNVVEELSASGSVTATLLTGLGIDEVFRRTDAGGSQHFLTDVLGSTVALLDGLGLIQTEYTSTPFGETTASGMPSSNAFQFTGRENDGTGLQYNRARYYHPVLQRFISEDPLGFRGGDVNLYGYAGNNPTNATDPTGLYMGFAPTGGQVGDFFFGTVGNTDASGNITDGTPREAGLQSVNPLVDPVDLMAGAATGGIQAARAARGAAGEMTSLYRAVSPAELSDITANGGAFRTLPGGAEGKYFSTTAEGAASFAKQTYGTGFFQGPYTIVGTGIPSSSITPIMRATVDRGISSVTVPTQMLPSLTPATPLPFSPLP